MNKVQWQYITPPARVHAIKTKHGFFIPSNI